MFSRGDGDVGTDVAGLVNMTAAFARHDILAIPLYGRSERCMSSHAADASQVTTVLGEAHACRFQGRPTWLSVPNVDVPHALVREAAMQNATSCPTSSLA